MPNQIPIINRKIYMIKKIGNSFYYVFLRELGTSFWILKGTRKSQHNTSYKIRIRSGTSINRKLLTYGLPVIHNFYLQVVLIERWHLSLLGLKWSPYIVGIPVGGGGGGSAGAYVCVRACGNTLIYFFPWHIKWCTAR